MAAERLAWLRPLARGNGALMTLFGSSFRPIARRQRDFAMAFDQDAGSPQVLWVFQHRRVLHLWPNPFVAADGTFT
jgi:hypothetical protein